MGNPFSTTATVNYNSNPPPDDGSAVSNNRIQWSTQKTKLADPIKTAFDTSETNTQTAFGKIPGGAGITSVGSNYTVAAGDQGKLIKVTASATITTPDATSVGAPFLFRVVNETTGDITLAGNNPGVQQNVDGAASVVVPAGAGVVCDTDGTNWFTNGQNFTKTQIVPQGRLTLVSGTAVISTDQTAKTAVYYTPYNGDQVPIPNGTKFSIKEFTELTLTLNGTNYVAGNIYDVFVAFNPADGTTVIVGSGPAWSTSTAGSGARGSGAGTTEIALLKGLWVNNNAITLRNNATTYSVATKCALYVGSIFIDTTNGQLNCHVSYGQSRKWDVSNAYNRRTVIMKAGDSTASWPYGTATIRPSNNAAANSITIFSGLAEEYYDLAFTQNIEMDNSTTQSPFNINGIGFNSTTAFTGKTGFIRPVNQNNPAYGNASYKAPPSLGVNVITALEEGNASGVWTFYGTETNMILSAQWSA